VGQALGVSLTLRDPLEQLGHALRARGRLLLVLDNLEQILAAAGEALSRWLAMAPGLQVLATSRARLALAAEEVVSVGPLSPLEAMALFAHRGQQARPGRAAGGFALGPGNRSLVGAVVLRLDCLPLAVELAAARLGTLPLVEIDRRLSEGFAQEGFGLLRGRLRDPEQRTLWGALAWSWGLLGPAAQAALAQCSVFRGGFDVAAAEAVLDLSEWAQGRAPSVMDVLEALVDDHLLRREGAVEGAPARYGMFAAIHTFAAEKLTATAAAARHAAHFAEMGSGEALDALDQHGGADRWRRLALEQDNLLAGARRGAGDDAAACCLAAARVLERRGPFARGVAAIEALLARGVLSTPSRGRLLQQLAQLLQPIGRSEAALEHLRAARAMHRADGDRLSEGVALDSLGSLHKRQGRVDLAREHFEAALAMHRAIGDRRREGIAMGNLGLLHAEQGRMDTARALLERALVVDREVGNRRFEGMVLANLGVLHRHQGRMDLARAHFEAALAVHRAIGNRRFEGSVLGNLGSLHLVQGRLDASRPHFEEALVAAREVGDRRDEGIVLGNLANLHRQQGRPGVALSHYEAALAVHRAIGDRRREGIALDNLGTLRLGQGQIELALADFGAALAVARAIGARRLEGVALGNLGQAHRLLGDLASAATSLGQGEPLLRALDDKIELGKLLCFKGLLALERGDPAAAALLAEATALAQQVSASAESPLGVACAGLRAALASSDSSIGEAG